jgi:hypothetical protein
MSRRDWIRVRVRWYTDPDHATLSGDALHLGPFLMMLADADPHWRETGKAHIRGPDGSALGVNQLSTLAKWTPNRTKKAIDSLVKVRTLCHDADGGYFFPNYRKHQEDPSASRKRRQRSRPVKVTRKVTRKVTGEAEAEAEAEATPYVPQGDNPVRRVLDHLNALRSEILPDARGFKPTKANTKEIRARIKEGHTAEELIAILDSRAMECHRDRTKVQWFNPVTPFRASNIAVSLAAADSQPSGAERTASGWTRINAGTRYQDGEIDLSQLTETTNKEDNR